MGSAMNTFIYGIALVLFSLCCAECNLVSPPRMGIEEGDDVVVEWEGSLPQGGGRRVVCCPNSKEGPFVCSV